MQEPEGPDRKRGWKYLAVISGAGAVLATVATRVLSHSDGNNGGSGGSQTGPTYRAQNGYNFAKARDG